MSARTQAIFVFLVFAGLLVFHFRAFLMLSWDQWLWGISYSADPIGAVSDAYSRYVQSAVGCREVHAYSSYPFGLELPGLLELYVDPFLLFIDFVTPWSGSPFVAYNAAIVLVFLINFLAIFYLVRRWFVNWYIAFIPATLIAFSVYSFAHSYAHIGLTMVFLPVAFLVYLLELFEKPGVIFPVLAGLVAGVTMYVNPYYFYFMAWMGVALLVVNSVERRFTRELFQRLTMFAVVMFIVLLPFLHDQFLIDYDLLWESNRLQQDYGEDLEMLSRYSAHPLDYLVSNVNHLIWGDLFAQSVPPTLSGATRVGSDELPVAIGLIPCLFALVLLSGLIVRGLRDEAEFTGIWSSFNALSSGMVLVWSLLSVAMLGFVLSLSPRFDWLGLEFYTLNEVLRYILPFRSYSRFAVLALIGISIMLALYVDRIEKPLFWTIAILVFSVVEVLPASKVHRVEDSALTRFLRERPEPAFMRFERENVYLQRQVDLEAMRSGKQTMNGQVNLNLGITDWVLGSRPEGFHIGYVADMGVELLVVNSEIKFPPVDQPFVQHLEYFPLERAHVWKLYPSGNEDVAKLFSPVRMKRDENKCHALPKDEVHATIRRFLEIIKS